MDGANEGEANGIVHSGEGPADGVDGEAAPNNERVTTPYMTKYEKARVLGTRALQIRCVQTASCK